MRAVTNSDWAISRLPRPSAASCTTRSSLGVSASRPRSARRRGRAPVATSSSRAPDGRGAELRSGRRGQGPRAASRVRRGGGRRGAGRRRARPSRGRARTVPASVRRPRLPRPAARGPRLRPRRAPLPAGHTPARSACSSWRACSSPSVARARAASRSPSCRCASAWGTARAPPRVCCPESSSRRHSASKSAQRGAPAPAASHRCPRAYSSMLAHDPAAEIALELMRGEKRLPVAGRSARSCLHEARQEQGAGDGVRVQGREHALASASASARRPCRRSTWLGCPRRRRTRLPSRACARARAPGEMRSASSSWSA